VLSGRGLCDGPFPRPEEYYGCREFCVLSGKGLCDGPIPRLEESYGCLSLVSVVYGQVVVSAMGRSLVQRSPTVCGVPECDQA
jgi:hypothetical protein